ncbi:hypothetical protein DEEACLCL_00156 [Salmonella phage CRW-SP2]|nr:hypothetical protein DEEACLCL_00156 [Salmonella phage CRW-SP2]
MLQKVKNPTVEREWFANKRSYEAFLYAMDCCLKMKCLESQGYIFINERSHLCKDWEIRIDGSDSCVLLDCVSFAGGEWTDDEVWKIWCTKKSVNEFLRGIKCIPPYQAKNALHFVR